MLCDFVNPGKSTIGRIRKEVNDKENGKGGYLTKLSSEEMGGLHSIIKSSTIDLMNN